MGHATNRCRHSANAKRPEYLQPHFEPLEDRKMLSTLYYNDDWTNETNPGVAPVAGNSVGHPTDFGTVTGLIYGTDAFGLETTSGAGSLPNVKDAIDAAADNDTVLVGAGTHAQSDIVLDKPLVLQGEGQGATMIIPEVASANTTGDFPSGTHSGIIIQMDPAHVWDAGAGDGVTITDLTIDGGLGTFGDLDYHHGITTQYETPGGPTVRNGTLTSTQWGGASAFFGAAVTEPNIHIDSVTVRNTYWHGITISANQDEAYDPGSGDSLALNIHNATVQNVGDTKDSDRIGILMQNINDTQVGTLGNLFNNMISDVGVGTKLAPFGTLAGELGNQLGANNAALQALQFVDNAAIYAFWIKDGRDVEHGILIATQSGGPQAGSVGIFLDHSRADGLTGSIITSYDVGTRVENTKFGAGSGAPGGSGANIAPFSTIIDLTGPGTGVIGSVGLLIVGDAADEAVFGLGPAASISGFETGAIVTNGNSNSDQSVLSVDRPQISGNGTDILVANNSMLFGPVDINSNISVAGTGIINPRSSNNFNFENDASDFYDGSTQPTAPPSSNSTPGSPLPDKAATAAATDITLGSGATFSPILTGEKAAPDVRWDFNNSATYPGLPAPPLNINGSLVDPQSPYGALTVWGGQVTQDGSGALVLGGTATNGSGLGFLYGTDSGVDPNNSSVYLLEPEDHSQRTHVNVALKLDPANEAKVILFGLSDRRANSEVWTIPTSILNTSSYTTVSIALMVASLELTEHSEDYGGGLQDDVGIDMSNIAGYVFGGDQGTVNGNQQVPLRFSVDEVTFTDQKNSMLEVSGSIDLGGATLGAEIRSGFVPGSGEEFTIVNNTGGGAVTGTFAGLAEGATLLIDGDVFTISYTGGDGNDVVLTQGINEPFPAITGRRVFYDNSKWDGSTPGINAIDSSAIPTKTAYLPGDGTITSASMTSYDKGINGIFIDITSTHGPLTTADFEFTMSDSGSGPNNINTPSTWTSAPAPIAFTVLSDTPSVGTDRVELIWADNAIENRYLEVTTKGNDAAGGFNTNTGLLATDLFYFGNIIGDTFNPGAPTVWLTTAGDETVVQAKVISAATIDSLEDLDRNGVHLASDRIVARSNTIFALNKMNLTNPPAAPAPLDGDDNGAGSAVASALAIPSTSHKPVDRSWVAARLAGWPSEVRAQAGFFQHPMEADDPRAREFSKLADAVIDSLHLDDDLLESLLRDLRRGHEDL